jgi:hypothetical protein
MEFLNRRTSDVYSCYSKTCIRRTRTPLDNLADGMAHRGMIEEDRAIFAYAAVAKEESHIWFSAHSPRGR